MSARWLRGRWLAPWLLLASVGMAHAQAAQVTTDVGPHYVGEPVSIRITAVGFEEEPAPQAELLRPADGRVELVGVSPSVSQSITIVNGQMTRTREVSHVFQFRFVPEKAGNLRLGPFRIHQGPREALVPVSRLKVQAMPSTDAVRIEVVLPEGEVYVGERVPVTVRFLLERSLQQNVLGYTLRVPLFDEQSAFRFLDEEEASGDTNVRIETRDGTLELRGETREERDGEKRLTVVSVTRTLVPLAPGTHRVGGASISVEEGIRFRRDFFGGRRATQVRRWRAEDPGGAVVVKAIPGREQPPSFGGAIGRGFSLEVSADRTVVQVGDPITLSLVLRGEGLETASLPPLDAEGLLPPEQFRVPSGIATGEQRGDEKRFTAVVRVLDDEVREIPALAYSWFDPDTKRYETTYSRPIALSARAAEVIGARDVQVSQESEARAAAEKALAPDGDEPGSSEPAAGRAAGLRLTGADLAIDPDAGSVLGSRASLGGRWLNPAVYAGSLLLVAVAWLDRRRRQVDPERLRRRRLLDEERRSVESAASLPGPERARQISQALRRLQRAFPEAAGPGFDGVLEACDALGFAPAGSQARVDESLVARALAEIDALREASA